MAKKTSRKVQESKSKRGVFIRIGLGIVAVVIVSFYIFQARANSNTIIIGLDAELTGEMAAVGQSSRNGVELAVEQINQSGGITVNGNLYNLKLKVENNKSEIDGTKFATEKLAKDKKVVAIVGPNASKYAIIAAGIAEREQIPLISPWSTNPETTLNSNGTPRNYIYRAAFLDSFQGNALAQFARDNLRAQKAAIIYDETADVLRGQADYFKKTFVESGGEVGEVQTYRAGDTDFTLQLRDIANYNPDVIFLPGYYQEASKIVQLARDMGITNPFLGSDAWASQEILNSCGKACNGSYMSAHYASDADDRETQEFVTAFKNRYQIIPDDVAALTYDSVNIIAQALEESTDADREGLKQALSKIGDFEGVTGNYNYKTGSGDPIKSVEILKIENRNFNWVDDIAP